MKTTDYSRFRNILGNRDITPAHVEKLALAIERKNLLQYFPVLVNEKMEVIDGQHRLVAAAKLNYPIHYEVVKGLELEDVMTINTHSKGWSTMDFIDTYITLRREDYQILKSFMQQYGIAPSLAASLLYGSRPTGAGSIGRLLRSGEFRVRTIDFAHFMARNLRELNRYSDFPVMSDRQLVLALTMLYKNVAFDFERLVAKLKLSGLKLERRATVQQYLLEIEELYNFKTKIRVELYASSQAAA